MNIDGPSVLVGFICACILLVIGMAGASFLK